MNGKLAIRGAWTAAGLLVIGLCANAPALAADANLAEAARVSSGEAGAKYIPLGIGKSVVVDLPRDAKDVLVANPAIANAVVRSARRAYLIGIGVGQTNVFFFDADGAPIAAFDIAVTRDLNSLRAALRKIAPDINAEGIGTDGVMLTGTVGSPEEAQQAFDLAARLVGEPGKVVNQIAIRDRDQVMLKVTVAEVQRDVVKQLGINLTGSIGIGSSVIDFNTDNPFTARPGPLSNSTLTGTLKGNTNSLSVALRAMEQAGVVRTLAEPNLTAISGEAASFLAGGEFPIVKGVSCQGTSCTPEIEFKKFGVSLNFTPVVLSEGRISLKVVTEVSELSTEGSITQSGFTIPALRVRRADTTVEIPSGGALALAGLIQEQTKQAINGTPGLLQLPVLGALFKSRDFVNRQSELVVLVTPYVVKAVARKQLSRPDDNLADASDPESNLLGKLNRIYGGVRTVNQPYRGSYGFILD